MKMRYVPIAALALLATACGKDADSAQRTTLGEEIPASSMQPEVRDLVDKGNAAYRQKDYQAALAHYQAAAEIAPEDVTPWYGVAMAAGALGEEALYAEARDRVNAISPEMNVGSHPVGTTTDAMGAGHPPADGTSPAGTGGMRSPH